ncbi:hypothetical protein LKO27_07035 [Tessaracoccus sp. OS52]|uniref:hypothetical protein n=1 Tax=Tessaracoccus sp. OS52 TaxID=2886691 RepID=UPI001D117A22|nr:hypothetical protein [Tessaracoccus sp. OS52]MCC2593164.1 hypothetical protein [Tessaracoccus sp. OS52]
MIWVYVFLGIGLAGLVTAVSYAVWLAHKASDLYSEVRMLGRRAEEAAELVGRLQLSTDRTTTLD